MRTSRGRAEFTTGHAAKTSMSSRSLSRDRHTRFFVKRAVCLTVACMLGRWLKLWRPATTMQVSPDRYEHQEVIHDSRPATPRMSGRSGRLMPVLCAPLDGLPVSLLVSIRFPDSPTKFPVRRCRENRHFRPQLRDHHAAFHARERLLSRFSLLIPCISVKQHADPR